MIKYWRQLDATINEHLEIAFLSANMDHISIIDAHPNSSIELPSVSHDLFRVTNKKLELGSKTMVGRYFYDLTIYARSKGERDDIMSVITNYFDQRHLAISDDRAAHCIMGHQAAPFYSTDAAHDASDFWRVILDGDSAYGSISNDDLLDKRKLLLDIDLDINSLVHSSERDDSTIYCDSGDAYITFNRIDSYLVTNSNVELMAGKSNEVAVDHQAYLVYNTSSFPDICGVSDVDLYFYNTQDVSLYSGQISVVTGDMTFPIATGCWDFYGTTLGPVIGATGWQSFSVDKNYINTGGYTYFVVTGISLNKTQVAIASYEHTTTGWRSYLDVACTGYDGYYEDHYIVDKFDENDWSGFKLTFDSGGTLSWTVGFDFVKLINQGKNILRSGERHHITASYDFTRAFRYDSKLFVDSELVDSSYFTWGLPPEWNEQDIRIGVGVDETLGTGFVDYADISIYSMKIANTKFTDQVSIANEHVAADGDDIVHCRMDEGRGDTAYDFRSSLDVGLYGSYVWDNYITVSGQGRFASAAKLLMKLQITEG